MNEADGYVASSITDEPLPLGIPMQASKEHSADPVASAEEGSTQNTAKPPLSPPIEIHENAHHTVEDTDLEHIEQQVDAVLRADSAASPSPSKSGSPLDAILAMTGDRQSPDLPYYEPLRGQWHYGQAVFARYKKTPYFFSGNIATYLGAGLFMIVFDDGSLNYRVKREDIVLRPPPRRADREGDSEDQQQEDDDDVDMDDLVDGRVSWYRTEVHLSDKPVMVDFSVSPPRQVSHGRAGYDVSDEASMDMKHLECGVAYEDDSTQVSDSDDSSDEDVNMTPWQQMTQAFGTATRNHHHHKQRASRRSSVSSLSQIERLSMNGKSMNNILASPKSIKQTIQDYLAKKTKKVQPSTIGTDPLSETIRKMEIRREDLRARYGRTPSISNISAISGTGGPDSVAASFTVTTISSAATPASARVVFQRESDDLRAYGTIKSRLQNGEYEIVVEGDQTINVHVLPAKDLDFLPSVRELERQIEEMQQLNKKLYAGRKVQVNLYPGTRFSGPGVVTLEDDMKVGMFHVLLQNRIRLINVPADKIVPLKEKKREHVHITEDQFLICSGKAKVQIGDQVYVKCEGDFEGQIEEKLGVLNGVYSNKTAAIDFADGSTGYEISPQLIAKRKRPTQAEDMDLMSLKNAVLMQAATGSEGFNVDVGYQVKADHPRRTSVESCVVIRKHSSTACDLRFADGTMAFGVFPSQMIIDQSSVDSTLDKTALLHEAAANEIVLAWSSRFGRYCTAKVAAKTGEGANAQYTVVFDYGELKDQVSADKLASIDDPDALSPTQKLTNYSFDTIGFEISPATFTVGEAVLARVHNSVQYFYGTVEAVLEKDRTCVVVFDSSERDEQVKFSAMFSVDGRKRFQSVGQPTGSASSTGIRLGPQVTDDSLTVDIVGGTRNKRRHSASSVGSMLMSVAGSIFRAKKEVERLERRASHLITEVGARANRRESATE